VSTTYKVKERLLCTNRLKCIVKVMPQKRSTEAAEKSKLPRNRGGGNRMNYGEAVAEKLNSRDTGADRRSFCNRRRAKVSALPNPPSPENTLALILGASNCPDSPHLAELPRSPNSAEDFYGYLTVDFGLPDENVKDLFDSCKSPAAQLREIEEWLFDKKEKLKDWIVFYTGHGGFTPGDRKFFLATRSTAEHLEGATSIRILDFATILKINAPRARKYLIFDCVLPTTATRGFMGSEADLRAERIEELFPSSSTAVLFSSSSSDDPRIPPNASRFSRFSEALFSVLRSSDEIAPTALSLVDVARRVREKMLRSYPEHGEAPVFELNLHGDGDLVSVLFFPEPRFTLSPPCEYPFEAEPAGASGEDGEAGQSTVVGLDTRFGGHREEIYPEAASQTLLDENVQFTVYRPREVQPRRWYKMLIFTHLDERPEWLDADEPSPIEEVEDEAQRILGPRLESYRKTTEESRLAVPREGEITLVPEMQGIEFNPPTRSFSWKDVLSVHLETFELRVAAGSEALTIVRGRVTIFLGHLILAEVALSIRVSQNKGSGALARVHSESSSARRFRRIFASYSHEDLEIAKEMEHYSLSLGDRYLRDSVDLRAGERWNERLLGMITEADIFQLFWSWSSSQSPYVEQEWRHALSLRRETFIRPTYWEDPWPRPPEPLRPIHFQRLEMVRFPELSRRNSPTTNSTGGIFTVRVIDRNGVPVADAKVEASARGGPFVDSYSNDAGVVQFSYSREEYGDTCKICVSKSGFQDNEQVHKIHSESRSEFTFTLQPKNVFPPRVPLPPPLPVPPPAPAPAPAPIPRIPWIIIILAAVCIVTGVAGVGAWWVVIGSKVRVPPLVGKNIEEAVHLLTRSNLVAEQTAPKFVSADKPANQVVSQDPSADQLVDRGSHVKLTVGIPKAKVPPLVGKNIEEAIRLLTESHLVADPTKISSPDKPPGQVISQDPAPNRLVDSGSRVKVRVSAPPRETPTPEFSGERFPQTRLLILQEADVANWSPADLRYAVKEMYARHGAIYNDRFEKIETEFHTYPWYHPDPNDPSRLPGKIEATFSPIELNNFKLLKSLRDRKPSK
jgi:hypothetical protein